MGKYTDIVGKSWETINLIPESIPHLFHWDLAYLWILEKESKLRPRIWQDRIEAWKYLVAGLLVGELQVSEEPLKNPFLQFVLPFGVEKVSWVSLPKTGEKIGVLSPTVLVRPLPDYNDQLSKWTKTLPDPIVNQSDRLAYFIQLLVSKTTSGSVIPPFFQRFCDILASEFHTNQKISNRFAGKEQKILIMNRFSWEVANTEPFQVPMSIYVFDARKSASNTFIPKCTSCRGFLLNGKEDEPLAIKANSISLKCRKCSKENEIKLDDLLIWNRESQKQLIVWEQENQEITVLPERHIEPDLIICEWNPAEVNSESHRFLHITANTSKILKTKIKDIFYRELLVPGDFEEFQGLPIRLEWFDALDKNLVPEIDVAGKTITYSLHLKGIPKRVNAS